MPDIPWHPHEKAGGVLFVHAHPNDPTGHGHDGYSLVAAIGSPIHLADDSGVRLPDEQTMFEELLAAQRDGDPHA